MRRVPKMMPTKMTQERVQLGEEEHRQGTVPLISTGRTLRLSQAGVDFVGVRPSVDGPEIWALAGAVARAGLGPPSLMFLSSVEPMLSTGLEVLAARDCYSIWGSSMRKPSMPDLKTYQGMLSDDVERW